MVTIVMYDQNLQEAETLARLIRRQLALDSDEKSCFISCLSRRQAKETLAAKDIADLSCVDLDSEDGIEMALDLREKYPETEMMLIAPPDMSPVSYMRPGIRASSLLLKPVDSAAAAQIIKEFVGAFIKKRLGNSTARMLRIEKKNGIISIPCQKICFLEARMKKVFICLPDEEYACRETLENLQKVLPDTFVRCHRGYIVNTKKVMGIDTSSSQIILDNGMKIPLSRTYRQRVKDMVQGTIAAPDARKSVGRIWLC